MYRTADCCTALATTVCTARCTALAVHSGRPHWRTALLHCIHHHGTDRTLIVTKRTVHWRTAPHCTGVSALAHCTAALHHALHSPCTAPLAPHRTAPALHPLHPTLHCSTALHWRDRTGCTPAVGDRDCTLHCTALHSALHWLHCTRHRTAALHFAALHLGAFAAMHLVRTASAALHWQTALLHCTGALHRISHSA
jgi:hypothetical protein